MFHQEARYNVIFCDRDMRETESHVSNSKVVESEENDDGDDSFCS